MAVKSRDGEVSDEYADKLLKILPPELTAVYFAVRSLTGAQQADLSTALFIAVIVLAVIFFAIAPKIINMQLIQNRMLYVFTFLVWVFAIDGVELFSFLDLEGPSENVLRFSFSATAAIWSFAAPHFLQKTE